MLGNANDVWIIKQTKKKKKEKELRFYTQIHFAFPFPTFLRKNISLILNSDYTYTHFMRREELRVYLATSQRRVSRRIRIFSLCDISSFSNLLFS